MKEKVMCPKCNYEPHPNDEWECDCGCLWNTFDTYGKCPKCGQVWKDTQCPACAEWSPHADWYLNLNDISISILEVEKVKH